MHSVAVNFVDSFVVSNNKAAHASQFVALSFVVASVMRFPTVSGSIAASWSKLGYGALPTLRISQKQCIVASISSISKQCSYGIHRKANPGLFQCTSRVSDTRLESGTDFRRVNNVNMISLVGKDAEIKYVRTGKVYGRSSLAVRNSSSYDEASSRCEDEDVEDAAMEDALEALFSQLEQDLQKADLSGRGSNDTATQEELLAFEQDIGALDAEEDLFKTPKVLTKGSNQKHHFTASQKHGQEYKIVMSPQGTFGKNPKRQTFKQKDIKSSMCLEMDSKARSVKKKDAAGHQDHILDGAVDMVKTIPDEMEGKAEEEAKEEDEEERVVKLEGWQLKKLVSATEIGRRRVNIKSLAAEVGLDRSDVLLFLRDPPPELLTAILEDTPEEPDINNSESFDKTSSHKVNATPVKPVEIKKGPHLNKARNWHSQKRLKKEVVTTFERVYRRTKRPTNSMIQNMVELTHAPRRRILQWFEDRRGVILHSYETAQWLKTPDFSLLKQTFWRYHCRSLMGA